MRRESVMKVFRNILEKSGMKDLVHQWHCTSLVV